MGVCRGTRTVRAPRPKVTVDLRAKHLYGWGASSSKRGDPREGRRADRAPYSSTWALLERTNVIPYQLANQTWIHQILIVNQTNSALAGVTEHARLARACCQVQPISGERGEVEEERGEAGRGKEKEEKDS